MSIYDVLNTCTNFMNGGGSLLSVRSRDDRADPRTHWLSNTVLREKSRTRKTKIFNIVIIFSKSLILLSWDCVARFISYPGTWK
jgi:hypothetical protein